MKPLNSADLLRPSAPCAPCAPCARPADLRADRIRARRRIAMRVGLLVIAMTSATACIFDQSTYQGGGRTDRGGATAVTATTPTPPDDGGTDAALGPG